MPKPRLLIITTKADVSLDSFYEAEACEAIEPKHIYYGSDRQDKELTDTDFRYVYFRDPFNDSNLNTQSAKTTYEWIIKNYPHSYIVDGLKNFEDMLFEDKWRQYKLFGTLMPQTRLLKDHRIVGYRANIVKKRISARSKDIIISHGQFPADAVAEDYIVQSKLAVDKEFRVFMVGGKIIRPLGIKSSKLDGHVSLIGTQDKVPNEIKKICSEVHRKTAFDLMGLDIARTKDGYFLLEVNRSPQFRGYNRVGGVNLAISFNRHLINQRGNR